MPVTVADDEGPGKDRCRRTLVPPPGSALVSALTRATDRGTTFALGFPVARDDHYVVLRVPRPGLFGYGDPPRLGTIAEHHHWPPKVRLTRAALLALTDPQQAEGLPGVGLKHAGLRCLHAAVLRDLAALPASAVADRLGYSDPAAARRAIRTGRARWGSLAAWPWWHFPTLGSAPDGWHERHQVALTWSAWREP